jgi:hypothetical protein
VPALVLVPCSLTRVHRVVWGLAPRPPRRRMRYSLLVQPHAAINWTPVLPEFSGGIPHGSFSAGAAVVLPQLRAHRPPIVIAVIVVVVIVVVAKAVHMWMSPLDSQRSPIQLVTARLPLNQPGH